MAGYVVSGAAVVLQTKDGSERYLYGGAPVVADAFKADSLKHALSVGLLSAVEDAEPEETPVAPAASWTTKQLTDYAEANGIDLGEAKTNPERLAAIQAAAAKA